MTDLLVKLYELPAISHFADEQITFRRALTPEKHIIIDWIGTHFSAHWQSECEVTFATHPVSCFIATRDGDLIGFACYDATAKGFFGPTGVLETARRGGVGRHLLLLSLHDMFAQGYAYAIIGGAGPVEFYTRAVNAVEIPGSKPGIYRGMLRS